LLAEILCGLIRPDSGTLSIGGREATFLDPARRNIGYVPQDYALLPFRTVAQNIAFGLEARRLPAAEIGRRVDSMLDLLGLRGLRDRSPRHLSGGERQRTALGRALVIEPELLVLDEPLSALDELTSEDLISKMATWHKTLKTTTLHICHRLEEALSLASFLAVMRNGRIEQAGAPETLMLAPQTAFIAEFLRLPNLISGEVREMPESRWFCADGEPLAVTDCPTGPACGLYPWMSATVSPEPLPPSPGHRVFVKTIARNTLAWTRPGLDLDGGFAMRLPGAFPRETWTEGLRVHVSMPMSGWRILPK
jgi:ABC-type Fe3+/spermidine/putrescine transport system ATPase subunit